MKPENIKIISSTIDRETKEGKIVIEVEEVPQSVNLLAKFFLKERSESDPDAVKLEEMDDYFMQVYQKNTGNSFSFARLKAIEAVLIKYGYQLEKGEKEQLINAMGWMSRELSRLNDITGQDNRIEEQLCVVHEIINKIEPHPKEIPDEVVYRTVKASERLPAFRELINAFLDGKPCIGTFERYGQVKWFAYTAIGFGSVYESEFHTIEWLEPIQLKDLLASK